jgi:hypothetical protein
MAVTKKAETKSAAPKTTEAKPQAPRGLRKRQEGLVVSSKMDKTIVVAVVRRVQDQEVLRARRVKPVRSRGSRSHR